MFLCRENITTYVPLENIDNLARILGNRQRGNASVATLEEEANKAKAEAVKEVLERLNEEAEKVCIDREGDFVEADGEIYDTVADWCKKISDNIVKEMVGEDNA